MIQIKSQREIDIMARGGEILAATVKLLEKIVSGQLPGFVGFDGLNHRDQRLANNGNQFSLEPPDQGLAVGGGFVVEAVNDGVRVFNPRGSVTSCISVTSTKYGSGNVPPGSATVMCT